MLFTYKYVNHPISRLQDWLDFLFVEVWCNAQGDYDLNLLDKCPDLKKVAEEEAWKEDATKKAKDYITGPIAVIFDLFKDELTLNQRKHLKGWYQRNSKLERICNSEKYYTALSIDEIAKLSKKLAIELKTFYINLYENVLSLAVIKNKNGTLKNHYDKFVKINNKGICPFCGINPIRSYEMVGHEAYDHFLPKEKYPFLSVNFKNLVPTCNDCNSTYKFRDSPIINKKTKRRRKAFYPYSHKRFDIQLKIEVDIKDYKFYEHKNITIKLKCSGHKEEVETWQEVYSIETRYKDRLTNSAIGKYWLVQYLDEMNITKRKDSLNNLWKTPNESKFRGENFLKIPFLKACQEKGIL